mmetsp:Transcript_19263/g.32824  ORF Transcript_19263/g.32824 Transcript_19263/m.32824 type:complete len:113 (-) Transcript_19263:29-367(-)
MFGTMEGSLGSLVSIPKYAYQYLQRLSEVMQVTLRNLSRITLSEQRSVRIDGRDPEDHFNIIDGAYVEMFLELDPRAQQQIVQNMLLNQGEMCQQYVQEVTQLIQLVKDISH